MWCYIRVVCNEVWRTQLSHVHGSCFSYQDLLPQLINCNSWLGSTINSLLRCQSCLVFNSWEYYKLPTRWHLSAILTLSVTATKWFYVSLTFWNIPLHHVSFRLTEIPLHHVATYNPVYKGPRPQPLLSLSGNSTQTRQPSLLWLPVLRPVMLSSSMICGVISEPSQSFFISCW